MTSTRDLAGACGLPVDDLQHWGDLIATGSGYTRVTIPQKRRRPREVVMPSFGLDRLLKQLSPGLAYLSGYVPQPPVHGFVKGRDIRTNALQHLDRDVVLRVDLKDFFGTVGRARLVEALQDFGFTDECAAAIAGVTLISGSLPQGFSTSPFLSNLVFDSTDRNLNGLATRTNTQYTRYVDDIIFSGSRADVHDRLLETIRSLLDGEGWTVNDSKTRFMRRGRAQYVTGLYVGDPAGPHIPRTMKRLLRREVYFASKFGLEDARTRSPTPMDADRLGGWVHYAAHVDPAFGQDLRTIWRQVASERPGRGPIPDWDLLLDDIGFPDAW